MVHPQPVGKPAPRRCAAGRLAPPLKEAAVSRPAEALPNLDAVRKAQKVGVLWLKGNEIPAAFEVHYATGITEGVLKMLCLPKHTKLVFVIPDERESIIRRKMGEAVFQQLLDRRPLLIPFFSNLDKLSDVKGRRVQISLQSFLALVVEGWEGTGGVQAKLTFE